MCTLGGSGWWWVKHLCPWEAQAEFPDPCFPGHWGHVGWKQIRAFSAANFKNKWKPYSLNRLTVFIVATCSNSESEPICLCVPMIVYRIILEGSGSLWKLREGQRKVELQTPMWGLPQGRKSYCPWILAHMDVFGSNVFVAVSNFLAQSPHACLLPGFRQAGLVGRDPSREQRSEDYWSGFLFNHL